MPSRFRPLALAAAAAAPLVLAAPAGAQTAPAAPELSFAATPYLWVAGISGSVRTPNQTVVPSQDINVSFRDTMSNLSGLAFMGAAEMRYGNFALLGDIMTLRVESDVGSAGPAFSGGTARVTTTMATVLGMVRVMEGDQGNLDLGAGVRPWSISTRLSMNAGVLPAVTAKPSLTWTDPLLALRYTRRFDENWGVSFYGDIGGFNTTSNLTWQLLGTVDYRIGSSVNLRAGYRHLQIENNRGGTDIEVGLSGPIIGATFIF